MHPNTAIPLWFRTTTTEYTLIVLYRLATGASTRNDDWDCHCLHMRSRNCTMNLDTSIPRNTLLIHNWYRQLVAATSSWSYWSRILRCSQTCLPNKSSIRLCPLWPRNPSNYTNTDSPWIAVTNYSWKMVTNSKMPKNVRVTSVSSGLGVCNRRLGRIRPRTRPPFSLNTLWYI